ncbi:ImmA/IrrE family metallo-endopeptidase [Amycolatopsis bartoniae]|uniref:ImmA/IrrE family metallo-endopeptidase n=1 Tax=Amycolatopsis bartoniae TaxID=941986 RepID=UPI0017488105
MVHLPSIVSPVLLTGVAEDSGGPEASFLSGPLEDLGTSAQDAGSSWRSGGVASDPGNRGLAPDRERFTLAHELGYLLMHELPHEDQERQANQFAGEFLAPAQEIPPTLQGPTVRQFARLAELKKMWKASMAFPIQRSPISDASAQPVQVISYLSQSVRMDTARAGRFTHGDSSRRDWLVSARLAPATSPRIIGPACTTCSPGPAISGQRRWCRSRCT